MFSRQSDCWWTEPLHSSRENRQNPTLSNFVWPWRVSGTNIVQQADLWDVKKESSNHLTEIRIFNVSNTVFHIQPDHQFFNPNHSFSGSVHSMQYFAIFYMRKRFSTGSLVTVKRETDINLNLIADLFVEFFHGVVLANDLASPLVLRYTCWQWGDAGKDDGNMPRKVLGGVMLVEVGILVCA